MFAVSSDFRRQGPVSKLDYTSHVDVMDKMTMSLLAFSMSTGISTALAMGTA